MGELTLHMPGVPETVLFPNRLRGRSWTTFTVARKHQREEAYLQTKALMGCMDAPFPHDTHVTMEVLVTWPGKGRATPDTDNLLSALKGLLDGIFLALDRDDGCVKRTCIEQVTGEVDDKAGSVEVTLQWT